MKQRKFRKLFWCWTFQAPYGDNVSYFMRSHRRKVKL